MNLATHDPKKLDKAIKRIAPTPDEPAAEREVPFADAPVVGTAPSEAAEYVPWTYQRSWEDEMVSAGG